MSQMGSVGLSNGFQGSMRAMSLTALRYIRIAARYFDKGLNYAIAAMMTLNYGLAMADLRLGTLPAKAFKYNRILIQKVLTRKGNFTALADKFSTVLLNYGRMAASGTLGDLGSICEPGAHTVSAADASNHDVRVNRELTVRIKINREPDFTDFLIGLHQAQPFRERSDRMDSPQTYMPLRGSRSKDFLQANKLTGRGSIGGRSPSRKAGNYNYNWTWHHHEVPGIMQLVLNAAHADAGHSGGVYFLKLATGKRYTYK